MEADLKKRLIESIKNRLEDDVSQVKYQAVRALSTMEEVVDIAIPLLVDTIVNGDKLESGRAQDNLIAVGEPAVEEIIEKLVNHPTDQSCRLVGINLLHGIYHQDKHDTQGSCCSDREDPHNLGPIMRRAVRRVLAEGIESFLGEDNEAEVADSD